MADLDIDVRFYDIPRLVSVYSDNAGMLWWAKAWFNNREMGEPSVEVGYNTAKDFIEEKISKQQLLEEFYPEQMKAYHTAMEKAREQLISNLDGSDNQMTY